MHYGTVNPELLGLARQRVAQFQAAEKRAFIQGGDPAMMGGAQGGDPAAAGGDPSMGGGAPAGGDPSMGGAPPQSSDPTAGAGNTMPDIGGMIQQQVQTALAAQGGGAMSGMGNGAGAPKVKIDENVVMLQILKILARISDTLGVKIPASEMVTTTDDLKAMAQGGPGAAVAQDQQQQSGISPISPIQGAAPSAAPAPAGAAGGGGGEKAGTDLNRGFAFDTAGLGQARNKASAIIAMRNARG